MAFGDADLASILAGPLAVAVVFGGSSTRGFLDIQHADVLDPSGAFQTQVQRTTVLIQTGTLPGVTADSAITVDAIAYKVRGPPDAVDDGRLERLTVVPA